MKRKSIRIMALELALSQLLSIAVLPSINTAHAEPVKDEFVLVGNPDVDYPMYMRRDDVTGNLETIKIFDSQNIKSRQYGANQRIFNTDADELLEDPVIWNMIEEYFPSRKYQSIEEAKFVYTKLLYWVYESGCGYAVDADFIMSLFEGGHEKTFLKKFGFPMYKLVDGKLDFNYEPLVLGTFLYNNFAVHKSYEQFEASIAHDLSEFRLSEFMRNNPTMSLGKEDIRSWTDEDWNNYHERENKREARLKELAADVKNNHNEYYNFGVFMDSQFGYLDGFLSKYGITINGSYTPGFDNPEVGNIIGSNGFTLTEVNPDGSLGETQTYKSLSKNGDDNEGHYMYISEIDEDGNIYVSSWGGKYLFDNSNSLWTDIVSLKLVHK